VRLERALENGAAAERFARMVRLQGGPGDLLERPDAYLPSAPVVRPVPIATGGAVAWVDTRAIGLIVRDLGGGRLRAGDTINPAVGLENLPSVGDHVEAGAALATVHAADEVHAERAALRLLDAVQLTEARPAATRPVVHDRLVPGRSAVN
jgi:thymidine phosphorylase